MHDPEKLSILRQNAEIEEIVLDLFDTMRQLPEIDQRWLAIARTHIEQGFLAVERGVKGRTSYGGTNRTAAALRAKQANEEYRRDETRAEEADEVLRGTNVRDTGAP
jgi:hypothetical protein